MNKSITINEEDSILLYTSVFLHLKQEFSRNNANKNILSSWQPSTQALCPRVMLPLVLNTTDNDVNFQ